MTAHIAPADLEACSAAIRTGSLSFHAASRLLPKAVRDPALALYAFCRLADDAVDEGDDKTAAVLRLRDRLDRVYAGRPVNAAADRAFAAVVEGFDMPRALPDALLEGMAWDAVGRRYDDLSGVLAYSARVAAAVGAMMCVLMRVREADALARACDLGLAMQLTNIARDVGEDARAEPPLPAAGLASRRRGRTRRFPVRPVTHPGNPPGHGPASNPGGQALCTGRGRGSRPSAWLSARHSRRRRDLCRDRWLGRAQRP
jgi:hypothetical protein